MKSASEYWKERFGEEPKSDNDKLMCAMMLEYAEHYQEEMQQALSLGAVSVSLPSDPMVLAKYLHDNYEQIAKRTNWNTQENCKVEFEDLPIENKNTMILLAGKLILDFVGNER